LVMLVEKKNVLNVVVIIKIKKIKF